MSVIQSINLQDFSQQKAIEINGEVFDLPQRTGEFDSKVAETEKKRATMKEYDFLAEIIEVIFGKANAKKIIKNGTKTNLDFMAKIYIASLETIYEDKAQAEREAAEKRLEEISPLIDKIDKASPILKRIK